MICLALSMSLLEVSYIIKEGMNCFSYEFIMVEKSKKSNWERKIPKNTLYKAEFDMRLSSKSSQV